MKVRKIEVKSILTKSNLPDADFVINPYTGCQHGCIYCYADFIKRFTKHTGEEWGSFVDIKINASETIKPGLIKKDSLILIGSVTDPYQPLEAKYQITRKCLEKLLDAQPKLEILTKSPLVLRDLDLLKKFKYLKVGISIGFLDKEIARKLEPYVASPERRLETLKQLHEEGISTYLFISPIFPEITDFKLLINSSKDYVDKFLFENLNIRANNKKKIFDFLEDYNPNLIPLYEKICRGNSYWKGLENKIIEYCGEKKIPYKIYFHHKGAKKK